MYNIEKKYCEAQARVRQGSGKGQARMGKDGQGWARQGSGKDCQGMLTKKPLKA